MYGTAQPDSKSLGNRDTDGALVGGASLDPKSFMTLVEAAIPKK